LQASELILAGEPQNDLTGVWMQSKTQSRQPVQNRPNRCQAALSLAPQKNAGGAEHGYAQARCGLPGKAVIQDDS